MVDPFGPEMLLRREPSTAWRVIDGEAVMVLPSTGKVHTLNAVATRFWQLIDGERSLAAIAALLAEEFDAPADQIAGDCRQFVVELSQRGLLAAER
jgi:pyrroloquinoline quinone biosynthesis protein D